MHCPTFDWEITGEELLQGGRLRRELGGLEMFLAVERISDQSTPRDLAGEIKIEPKNGPHGHRPVYFYGRQVDDAKVWSSAMFITFKK